MQKDVNKQFNWSSISLKPDFFGLLAQFGRLPNTSVKETLEVLDRNETLESENEKLKRDIEDLIKKAAANAMK